MVTSDHVVKLIKPYKSKQRHYLITELCNGGDLQGLINLRKRLTEDEARILLRQIAIGLRDINSAHIMHRDLKLANILLHFPNIDLLAQKKQDRLEYIRNMNFKETPFEIKISDFGFAKVINSKKDLANLTICGTPAYMPPDQILNHKNDYTEKIDVWALGSIYYELIVG